MIDPALVGEAERLRMMLGAAVDTAAGFVTLHPDVQGEQLGDLIQQHFESSIERADELLSALAQAPAAPPTWQPIETFDPSTDAEVWFWVVPKSANETYTDTSGRPIMSQALPRMMTGRYKHWSALEKATHWMPLPAAPRPASAGQEE